ncbi:MAG: hypothetical protein KGI47_10685 [Betaproteobacteria bacterium]|nr:hypothetical protein [Betaproteobacteria bacterium]
MKTLRFSIQGTWTAQDFTDYFFALDYIYSVLAIVEIEQDSFRDWERRFEEFDLMFYKMLGPSRRFRHWLAYQRTAAPGFHQLLDTSDVPRSFLVLESSERLRVRGLEFASPGHTDLSGLGKAMEQVKDIVTKLIDIHVGSDERRTRNEILEEDRKAAALRNLREYISILKDLGYTEVEIREIVASSNPAMDKLVQLTNRGVITSVTERVDDGEG